MKTMLVALVGLAVFVGLGLVGVRADSGAAAPATSAPAAQESGPVADAVKMMSDRLALTPEQVKQVTPILTSELKQRQAIAASKTTSPTLKQTQTTMVHQFAVGQLKEVLTPGQFAQLMQGADYSAAWGKAP